MNKTMVRTIRRHADVADTLLDRIPPILPDVIVDGENRRGYRLCIETWGPWEAGKAPYLRFLYRKNKKKYVFCSMDLRELVEYLLEFNLILEENESRV